MLSPLCRPIKLEIFASLGVTSVCAKSKIALRKEKYCRKPIFTTGMSIDFWNLFLRTTGETDDSLYRVQYLGNTLLMMARE